MQNEMYQSEPNLIGETYRNHTNLQMPLRIERHFDFLEISEDGLFLLGTSNLSGRIWSGAIWIFEEYCKVPEIEKCLAGIEFESSVASGLWLDSKSKKILIGCDSGSLNQLSLNTLENKKKNYFTTLGIITEHDDSIVSLTLMDDSQKFVSGSMDMNIKVWDRETFTSYKSYCPAHGHLVTSVSSSVNSKDVFISTSLDGTSLIWDIRLEKPASLLLENKCGFTASSWIDDQCASLGSCDGSVLLVDIRMKSELDKNSCSKRPIFSIKYNKTKELLAICADDPIVRVFSAKEKNLMNLYEYGGHEDFVRGLTWEPNSSVLYSCGWDSKILRHEFALPDSKETNEENLKKENVNSEETKES